ncbi:MAG: hypothetical protein CW346_05845 [Bacillaceae bacterium]|nr:hypothetical protein [Bacillaceae bacterium]
MFFLADRELLRRPHSFRAIHPCRSGPACGPCNGGPRILKAGCFLKGRKTCLMPNDSAGSRFIRASPRGCRIEKKGVPNEKSAKIKRDEPSGSSPSDRVIPA